MNEYFKSDMLCSVDLKDGFAIFEIEWSFLMTEFISVLYDDFGDRWTQFRVYYADTEKPYGIMTNTEETLKLKDRELTRTDFDAFVVNDFLIDCELFLKSEPTRPRYYTISLQNLLNNFVREMYDLHGEDWDYFTTFFNDSKDIAYGLFKNDKRLKEIQKITESRLHLKRNKVNKEKWALDFYHRNEIFYVLVFKDTDFLKIGHTFRKMESRLYNYLFPYSEKEAIYEDTIIDFEKSYFVETDISNHDLEYNDKQSLESLIKISFNHYTFENEKYGRSKEILSRDGYSDITKQIDELLYVCDSWKKTSLLQYTGFKDSAEMIIFNLSKGVFDKPKKFFGFRKNPTIYFKEE